MPVPVCQCRTHLFLKPPHLRNVPYLVSCHPWGRACRFFFLFLRNRPNSPPVFLSSSGSVRSVTTSLSVPGCRLLQSGQMAFQPSCPPECRGRHIHHPPDQPCVSRLAATYRVYPCRLRRFSVVAFQPVYHLHRVRLPAGRMYPCPSHPGIARSFVQKQCDRSPVCFAGAVLHEQAAFFSLRLLEHLLFVPYCRDDAQHEQSQHEIKPDRFSGGGIPSHLGNVIVVQGVFSDCFRRC